MAISFSCQCGKPLQAKEEFAGRKMRCPACGSIMFIPTASGIAAENVAPEISIPSTPTELQTAPVRVPGAVTAATVTKKPARSVRKSVANIWTDPTFGQEIAPWPEHDKVRAGAISSSQNVVGQILISLLIVALLAGGIAAGFYYKEELVKTFGGSASTER